MYLFYPSYIQNVVYMCIYNMHIYIYIYYCVSYNVYYLCIIHINDMFINPLSPNMVNLIVFVFVISPTHSSFSYSPLIIVSFHCYYATCNTLHILYMTCTMWHASYDLYSVTHIIWLIKYKYTLFIIKAPCCILYMTKWLILYTIKYKYTLYTLYFINATCILRCTWGFWYCTLYIV